MPGGTGSNLNPVALRWEIVRANTNVTPVNLVEHSIIDVFINHDITTDSPVPSKRR